MPQEPSLRRGQGERAARCADLTKIEIDDERNIVVIAEAVEAPGPAQPLRAAAPIPAADRRMKSLREFADTFGFLDSDIARSTFWIS